MNKGPLSLYSATQTRQLDQQAINDAGIPGYTLMNRAGAFAFDVLMTEFNTSKPIIIVCGIGNNGGDGYVVARLAAQSGIAVKLLQLGQLSKQKGDALVARRDLEALGVRIDVFTADSLAEGDVIVDAIFGTGLEREVEGEWASAIEAINASSLPVLSIDIPSGLHADSGRVQGVAIKAKVTTTFIGRKQGMYTAWGPQLCGEIRFSDLAVPNEVYRALPASIELIDHKLLQGLPQRRRNAHKGDQGHVLLVGGEQGFSGAIRMAGEAALRTGAGLTSIATRDVHAAIMAQTRPELMCHGVEKAKQLDDLIEHADVLAIGPGLGQDSWGESMFEHVANNQKRSIYDADALNMLARQARRDDNWILTPHPGEAARLLDCVPKEIENDRFHAVKEIQQRYGGICILKGCGTLICDGQRTIVCDLGNPGMASGGSGDVLTGVLAALLAQLPQWSLFEIAQLGVLVHALAGDRAALKGERGMIASDIINEIRSVLNHVAG